MKKWKMTPDEFRAWWDAREARIQELRRHEERIRAELAARKAARTNQQR